MTIDIEDKDTSDIEDLIKEEEMKILVDKETGEEFEAKRYLPSCEVYKLIPMAKTFSWDDVADDVLFNLGSSPYSGDHLLSLNYRENHSEGMRFSDKWNVWRGGECPLPEGVIVEVEYRSGGFHYGADATVHNWNRTGVQAMYIIAYRVIRLADGYKYPDEVEQMK